MIQLAKSFLTIAMVSFLAIGATKACFSGQSVATNNTFAAGVLELLINNRSGVSKAFTVTDLKPGANDFAGQVVLKNPSKINGRVWLEIKNVRTTGNGALGNLAKARFFSNETYFGGTKPLKQSQNQRLDLFDLPKGQSAILAMYAIWDDNSPNIDNPAQGQKTTFDVVFHLDQKVR
ncbi:hypothetical protein KBB76_00935 [Candidatus Saccharibacteria bacterium]|nr:hypothetical protein [Candidatus Saccharibacteria bacterium]